MPRHDSGENPVPQRIESIERLIREIEDLPDPSARTACTALVQSLLELHGAGIERMLEIVHKCGATGQKIIDELGQDEIAGNILLVHGLHPLDLTTRVIQAIDKARPYLRSHGGDVQLVSVTDAGAVTIRLEGSCHSCPSSSVTLQSTVEQAIYTAAPDVTDISVEGVTQEPADHGSLAALIQIHPMGEQHLPVAPVSTAEPNEVAR